MRGKSKLTVCSQNQILRSTSSCLSCSWTFLPPVLQVLSQVPRITHPACPVPWPVPLHVLAIVPWPCVQACCLLTKLFLRSLPHFFLLPLQMSLTCLPKPCKDKSSSTAHKASTWNIYHFHTGLSLPTLWSKKCLPALVPPYHVGPWHFWEDPTGPAL